jgi:hypothetical protein
MPLRGAMARACYRCRTGLGVAAGANGAEAHARRRSRVARREAFSMVHHTPAQPYGHHTRRDRRHRRDRRTGVALGIRNTAIALLVATTLGCAGNPPPDPGSFIEEFEGFPIFHGSPGRPYRVLGAVYRAEAAQRGASPMKRAAVAEARRLGADAILLGPPPPPSGGEAAPRDTPPRPPTGDAPSAENKWEHAVAIQLD